MRQSWRGHPLLARIRVTSSNPENPSGTTPCIIPHGGLLKIIRLKVKPRARLESFAALDDGTYVASVKASPVDGKANAAVVALVANHFGLARARVRIKTGTTGRQKLIQIED